MHIRHEDTTLCGVDGKSSEILRIRDITCTECLARQRKISKKRIEEYEESIEKLYSDISDIDCSILKTNLIYFSNHLSSKE